MRTVQFCGVPDGPAAANVEAGVVALKSRSNAVEDAVRDSLDALKWLQAQGCQQFFFKYCSTYDSTPQGNIGPVADALIDALGADRVIVCPAFPGAGRSLYQGHLFVNNQLLNESGMQSHPLTPMTDANIRRWLEQQSRYRVGLVTALDVFNGVQAIKSALAEQRQAGNRLIVVDAIRDDDLIAIGSAADDSLLVTGGSGVAMGLPANFRNKGLLDDPVHTWSGESGHCVALVGSCSKTTLDQIDYHALFNPVLEISESELMAGRLSVVTVGQWLLDQPGIPLAYSSADPAAVAAIQQKFGRAAVAGALDDLFAEVAKLLVAAGIKRLLIAGGETSGAVVEGLQLDALEIGPEIDTGISALRAGADLVIALKSGNFGTCDYFAKAAQTLASPT
jgi:uncharacterized protein YgbK (DUF1537 family)